MQLLEELGIPQDAPVLWCDNKSTLAMTQDPVFSARSKHIEARYFFIRELKQRGHLRPQYVATIDNVADVFTKALGKVDHCRLMHALSLRVREA